MSRVVLEHVGKIYRGGVEAVKDLSLEIRDGEFMCLLGPSGCGKSTTMRMIAGLEEITSGKLFIDDRCVNEVPSRDRDIAMAFENYALYPHMTIGGNIAFPLEIRKMDKREIRRKVAEAAELLGIGHLLDESVKGLSGGVQQRVGVARALVRNPKVLILDEPISHLEEQLKAKMREELRKLQRRLNVTTLYVTHDQIEAMVMADRIAIMNFGVLQQVDSPAGVYLKPHNDFVGGFIGEPPMNFVDCRLADGTHPAVEFGDVSMPCDADIAAKILGKCDGRITLGVRDSQIGLSAQKSEGAVQGSVFFIEPRNEEQLVTIELGGNRLLAVTSIENKLRSDDRVWVKFMFDRCNFFDGKSGKNLFAGE
jgi:multiple sugar transport system ATP-binding protein